MSLFLYDDYRLFLKDYLLKLPKKGHGELSKMAKAIGVHSTLMSMVLSAERDLNLEQAHDLGEYLGLTDLESEYLSLLVQLSRAGNHRYQKKINAKIQKIREESQQISKRFNHEKVLSEEQRLIFYSSWIYSAIRNFVAISENGKSLDEIQNRFQIPRPNLIKILEFLVQTSLIKTDGYHYQMGPQRTFLPQNSPHVLKHHSNWRIKALQQADLISEKELMFTSPMSIARTDFEKVREMIADLLKQFSQIVKDSPSEDVACLNIDFFWVK